MLVCRSGCCHFLLHWVLVLGVSLVDVSTGGCQVIHLGERLLATASRGRDYPINQMIWDRVETSHEGCWGGGFKQRL